MEKEIISQIRELEEYIGFPIEKREVTLDSGHSHDETFSYNLCLRFYNKEEELKKAITLGNNIISNLLKKRHKKEYHKDLEMLYSLTGSMYYILGDFNYAAGYFMKCLSYNKKDISHWIELLFSLRAMGEFDIFETGIFNFEKLVLVWKNDASEELTQEKVLELIDNIKKNNFLIELHKDKTQNVIHIGGICNNNCICCPNTEKERKYEKSFDMISQSISEINPDFDNIIITGGEPTIKSDIFEIISIIEKKFPDKKIFLLTNGRKLADLQFSKELLKHNIIPTISLYGPKTTHDFISTIDGSFEQAIKGVKNLVELGKKFPIIIVFNKINFKEVIKLIENLIELDKGKHLINFHLQATDYIGYSAKNNMEDLHISVSEITPYLNNIINLLDNKDYKFNVFFPLCILKNNKLTKNIEPISEKQETYFSEKCEKCILNNKCNKIWSSYISHCGDKEINCVTNDDLEQWS